MEADYGVDPCRFSAEAIMFRDTVTKDFANRRVARSTDFVAHGLVLLFWGAGLATFFSLAHIWFAVKFYGVEVSVVPIVVIAVAVLSLLAAVCAKQSHPGAPVSVRTRTLFLTTLLLWVVPFLVYLFSADTASLVREREAVRAYRADPTCSIQAALALARQTPRFESVVAKGDVAQPICSAGWTRVTGKSTAFGYCLALEGSQVSASYCVSARHKPDCDWDDIRIGDAIVAQTAYGSPALYYCPTKDLLHMPFYGQGVLIETAESPFWKLEMHGSVRFVWVALYLALGAGILYSVIRA